MRTFFKLFGEFFGLMLDILVFLRHEVKEGLKDEPAPTPVTPTPAPATPPAEEGKQ